MVIGLDDDDDDDSDDGNEDDENDDVDENDDDEDEDEDNDDGFCFVTKTGSVVTCQWEVCGMDPAALEWKTNFTLCLIRNSHTNN